MNEQRLAVELPGLTLKNPVMPASGSFGFGDGRIALENDLNQLGAVVLKTTTKNARTGNPQPQIAQFPEGVLNSVGLTNPGVKAVVQQKLPALRTKYPDLPLIGSVAGESVEDYMIVAQQLAESGLLQALELNVSCPNVAEGGMQFGVDPRTITKLTSLVKQQVDLPVYVKLSPNVTDIVECAQAAALGGADGLTMINTVYGMRIDPVTRRPAVGNVMGGWSGPSLKPLAIRMIYQVAQQVALPIIGVGGISSAADVIEMYLAGASAVQVGTAQFSDPLACWHIIADLEEELDKLQLTSLTELRNEVKEGFLNERR
ncbi:dihydroorotate dehydrogenase [Ligilactobacillus pabuli]|uniref:Dihydroorotate dehydrogenase n=1 Tax=Ligilactobacillus pabuli TaxID=2886039 RepID=A0ABQ5JFD0_9LACO|nr:dihydroorotate dehydrogenase [Ligilactobacillus pabuli]GKS80403.1 dihydroorotate dehydrogenase [Ligilactobacillus pabuli]